MLHPQLAAVVSGLEGAQERLGRLVATLPPERWSERADPAHWSVAECIAHLNLTGQAYVPQIREALEEARRLPALSGHRRYRRGALGWLLTLGTGPLPGLGRWRVGRVRTTAPFVPTGDLPREQILAEFDRLQQEQIELTREAEGLAVDRVDLTSPFDPRIRYNLFVALVILPRHQHRHLAQAERVWSVH